MLDVQKSSSIFDDCRELSEILKNPHSVFTKQILDGIIPRYGGESVFYGIGGD
jgi:hypothetical protein